MPGIVFMTHAYKFVFSEKWLILHVCCSSSLLTVLSTNASGILPWCMTLRLPLDVPDATESTSEDVGAGTNELG